MATFDDVRRIALALLGTTETLSWGLPSWCVGGKGFVWERPLRKSDLAALGDAAPTGDILGVRTADLEEIVTDAWLARAPAKLAKEFLGS